MGLSRWDSRIGGPPGPDGFFSFWKRAATAISYQVAIAGVQYMVSITSFGALINATASALNTDDIPLNAALVYITVLGGGELYADEGDYNLADPMDLLGANIIITGAGRNTLIDGDGLANNEHAIQISGRDDCVIRNLAIQTQDGGGNVSHCIFIEDGSDGFLIEGVWIITSDVDGIHVEGTDINNGWIINCRIRGCDRNGIRVEMDDGDWLDLIHISKCNINTTGACIYAFRLRYSTICENSLIYGSEGLYLWIVWYCSFSSNIIAEIDGEGIHTLNVFRCTIEGNIIQLSQNNGILIDSTSDYNNITDNYLIQNIRYGIEILLANCNENTVKDNKYYQNTLGCINDLGTDTRVHEIVVEPEDRDASRGDHPVAQMLDNVSTTVRFGFGAPDEFQEAVTAQVVIIPAANGTLRRQVETDFGKVCSGEAYNAHSDAIAAGDVAGMIQDDLECIDVSAALTGLAARDTVGMLFIRDATAGSGDTIAGTVWVKEFRMRFV